MQFQLPTVMLTSYLQKANAYHFLLSSDRSIQKAKISDAKLRSRDGRSPLYKCILKTYIDQGGRVVWPGTNNNYTIED